MCGIVGIHNFNRQQPVDPGVLRRMRDAMIHRGPDGEGAFEEGHFGMGMRRLAIIDLAGGDQPIFNEDGQIAVVYNGEIYNYHELKAELQSLGHQFRTHSDTEVLVHGYEAWGDDLARHLNGMFAFCIWDRRRQRALIARDHIGIKPLYLYQNDQLIAWASEIKCLLEIPGVPREVDPNGLVEFLRFGYTPMPLTLFKGIRKLPPATQLVIEGSEVRQQSYWDLEFNEEQHSEAEWMERLQDLLDDAVQRQLMSDVPLGAFLSGGLDSSAIVASMKHHQVPEISTYAIGFSGRDAFHSELSKASLVASQFGTNHHEIQVEPDVADLMSPLIRHLDEPFTDTSFLVTYLVSKLARESVTVILSGIGGDEIFAGYRRYLGPRLQSAYQRIPRPLRTGLIHPVVRRLPVDRGSSLKSLFRYARGFTDQAEKPAPMQYEGYVSVCNGTLPSLLAPELSSLAGDPAHHRIAQYYESAPTQDPLNRMLYTDLKTSLVDSLLTFTDKMTMAVSLEARVPLLDVRLVEMAARIPANLKLHGFRGMKHIFKKSLESRLPPAIIDQKKQGFGTPISRWFRSSLKPLLHDYLSADRLARRGYFNPLVVNQLLEEHDQERFDHSETILALLTLEIWHEIYLDA